MIVTTHKSGVRSHFWDWFGWVVSAVVLLLTEPTFSTFAGIAFGVTFYRLWVSEHL